MEGPAPERLGWLTFRSLGDVLRWRAGIGEGVAAENTLAPVTGVVATERGPSLHREALPDTPAGFAVWLGPVWQLGDCVRGAPIRTLAAVVSELRTKSEVLTMVGLMKPSIHYFSRVTLLYGGRSPNAQLNLADHLR